MATYHGLSRRDLSLADKMWGLDWLLILLITAIAGIGFVVLYSAADGSLDPWASRQMIRFAVGVGIMIAVAVVDIRLWLRFAYIAYAGAFVLLAAVEIAGEIGMGARRWIDLGVVQVQPSEIMKVTLVLALARYFHGLAPEDIGRPHLLFLPLALVAAPALFVLRQPDLGTALLIVAGGGAIFFFAGVRIWKFILLIAGGLGAIPIGWQFLREYQKNRVLTFLNPENDPLGAGYHITQSKIALGSGGMFGRGFLEGTQSHLDFLPEKQTDFIFTMLAEEFGLVGGLTLLGLYMLVLAYGYLIAFRSRSTFGRLLAMGIVSTLFVYVFINIGMVMGIVPVVGIPLPLVSYGGTAMLSLLVGFGLLLNASVHRDIEISRRWRIDL